MPCQRIFTLQYDGVKTKLHDQIQDGNCCTLITVLITESSAKFPMHRPQNKEHSFRLITALISLGIVFQKWFQLFFFFKRGLGLPNDSAMKISSKLPEYSGLVPSPTPEPNSQPYDLYFFQTLFFFVLFQKALSMIKFCLKIPPVLPCIL